MSFLIPSSTTFGKILIPPMVGYVDDFMDSTYNRGASDRWISVKHPSQYFEPSVNDSMQSNLTTLYNYYDIPTNTQILINKFSVHEYNPEDLNVIIQNGFIVINGSHGEKKNENSTVSRKFTRRIVIPRGINQDDIKVHIASEGILTITAQKSCDIVEIPIHHTKQANSELSRTSNEGQQNVEMNSNEAQTIEQE